MRQIPLPGLRATEPIGFLAALGLLRVCTNRGTFGLVKLGWSDDAGWPTVLETERDCDPDRLVDELLTHMRDRATAPAFSGRPDPPRRDQEEAAEAVLDTWDDVKVPLQDYRARLVAVRTTTDRHNREAADFLSALGSELIPVGGKDAVKPSALHMTSGNQKFLALARELACSLDPNKPAHPNAACSPVEAFREAVLDQRSVGIPGWLAADTLSAMGYDANREAIYALTAVAPGPAGPRSTRAAVWLAVEALPMFLSLPVGRRLWTRGFGKGVTAFRWAVWDGTLGLDAVRTLLGDRNVTHPRPVAGRLRQLGIRAIMESARVTIGQGYGQFRPAVRVSESTNED